MLNSLCVIRLVAHARSFGSYLFWRFDFQQLAQTATTMGWKQMTTKKTMKNLPVSPTSSATFRRVPPGIPVSVHLLPPLLSTLRFPLLVLLPPCPPSTVRKHVIAKTRARRCRLHAAIRARRVRRLQYEERDWTNKVRLANRRAKRTTRVSEGNKATVASRHINLGAEAAPPASKYAQDKTCDYNSILFFNGKVSLFLHCQFFLGQ